MSATWQVAKISDTWQTIPPHDFGVLVLYILLHILCILCITMVWYTNYRAYTQYIPRSMHRVHTWQAADQAAFAFLARASCALLKGSNLEEPWSRSNL